MKGTILSVAMLAASVCVADEVLSSNVIGQLPVTSYAKRTIVSVPWCAMSAADDAAIQVSNLVKTANLTVGDMLHYVQPSGSYLSWRLTNGSDDVKYWQSVNIATENNEVTYTPTANSQTVARGNCIVLIRQNPGTKSSPNTFYLYGQVGTSGATVQTTVAQGDLETSAYSLIASPSPSAWQINDISWSGVNENDAIVVLLQNGYQKSLTPKSVNDKWSWGSMVSTYDDTTKKKTGETWTAYSTAIPAGTGVWYVSRGGNPTITW